MTHNLPNLYSYKSTLQVAKLFGIQGHQNYNFGNKHLSLTISFIHLFIVPEIDRIDKNGFSYYDFSPYYHDLIKEGNDEDTPNFFPLAWI